MDILYDPDMDLSLLIGVLLAGFRILCMRAGAVCWFSPECSTWLVFISRATYGRSLQEPWGSERHGANREQNAVACAVGQLMLLAHLRSVRVLLEQPLRSLMIAFPAIEIALRLISARRISTHLGAFGATSLKPLEL